MNTTNTTAIVITTSTLFMEVMLSPAKAEMFFSALPVPVNADNSGTISIKLPAWLIKAGLEKGELAEFGELLGDNEVSVSVYLANYKVEQRPHVKALKNLLDFKLDTMSIHVKTKLGLDEGLRAKLQESLTKLDKLKSAEVTIPTAAASEVMAVALSETTETTTEEVKSEEVKAEAPKTTEKSEATDVDNTATVMISVDGKTMAAPAMMAAAIASGGSLPKGVTLVA